MAARDVLSGAGDDDDGDFVVVALQELLCSANNVSDHDSGAQREDQVLVVGVQNESLVHLACKATPGVSSLLSNDSTRTYP